MREGPSIFLPEGARVGNRYEDTQSCDVNMDVDFDVSVEDFRF